MQNRNFKALTAATAGTVVMGALIELYQIIFPALPLPYQSINLATAVVIFIAGRLMSKFGDDIA